MYLYDPGTEFLYLPAQRTDYPEFVGRAYSARGGGIHAEHNLLRLERRANWGDIFQVRPGPPLPSPWYALTARVGRVCTGDPQRAAVADAVIRTLRTRTYQRSNLDKTVGGDD